MSSHEADSQDPPAVVVADDDVKTRASDLFSFAEPGKVTWWSLGIVGLLGCLTLSSIIIIAVRSDARQPPLAYGAMDKAQCPYVSPLLPVIAYTAWKPRCPDYASGDVVPCSSQVDCAWLAGACASEDVVAQLRCEVPTLSGGSLGRGRKVCAIVAGSSPGSQASTGGFCTRPSTACAVCTGKGPCEEGLTGCVPSSVCTQLNASSEWSCIRA